MFMMLWHDTTAEEIELLLNNTLSGSPQKVILAKNVQHENIGFAYFTIRTDYVEGAKQSPTGYLEGIFVEESYRKMGVAKKFIQLGEAWVKSKGCTQLGSDTWLSDTNSRRFHKKMGFWEEDELVHFLKDI